VVPGTTSARTSNRHEVEFYSEDQIVLASMADFIGAALNSDNPAIVMATKSHREGLIQRLASTGLDIDAAIEGKTYISLDTAEMLSKIMVNGVPDTVRFFEGLSGLISSASEAAGTPNPRVSVWGDCCGLLCSEGDTNSAIQLEKSGNELIKSHNVEILCAYPLSSFMDDKQRHAFASVCNEHSALRIR
jgi:hypothetical protein